MKILNRLKGFSIFELTEKWSFKLGEYLYNKHNPNENNKDIEYAYQYFFYAIFSQMLWILSGLFLSILANVLLEYVVCCISFICARRLSGGMHLNTHMKCYVNTVLLTLIFAIMANCTYRLAYIMFVISTSSVLCISHCIPKKSDNTFEYTLEEELTFKRRYCLNSALFFIINAILLYISYKYDIKIIYNISSSISWGILLSSFMLTNWFEVILKKIWKEK